jgi:hypothetical protein
MKWFDICTVGTTKRHIKPYRNPVNYMIYRVLCFQPSQFNAYFLNVSGTKVSTRFCFLHLWYSKTL